MNKKIISSLFIILVIIFIDLGSKSIVKSMLQDFPILTITSFLNFHDACNYGVSFGMLNHLDPIFLKIFIITIFTALIIYSIFLLKEKDGNPYLISMIIGGAAANLIDRFINNCVYDFLDFHINNYHWYIFNVADSFITVGVILLILKKYTIANS